MRLNRRPQPALIDTPRKPMRDRDRAERKRRAADWRRARRRLQQYDGKVRALLIQKWRTSRWSGDPAYLLSLLHLYDNGRLDLYAPACDEPGA